MMHSRIPSWNITGKTVIIRIDGNVPIAHQHILDDHKLVASFATINYLLDHGAQLMLLADITPTQTAMSINSCFHLVNWFHAEGITIELAQSINDAQQLLAQGHRAVMLENLAAFKQEATPDKEFAQALAQLGSFYINDAFGALSLEQSSTTLLPDFFDADHKSIGFLVEHELHMLSTLNPLHHRFSLFIGGIESRKIESIKTLLPYLDALYIGPAINFSFLKSTGSSVGMSYINPTIFNECREIIMLAEEYNVQVNYPQDYVITEYGNQRYYEITSSSLLNNHEYGISIGPHTAAAWSRDCLNAKAIIVHGLMGFLDKPEGLVYFKELLQAIHNSPATSILTGSSTIAAAHLLGLSYDMGYCSTGGTSTLAYLSNAPLPGLKALLY